MRYIQLSKSYNKHHERLFFSYLDHVRVNEPNSADRPRSAVEDPYYMFSTDTDIKLQNTDFHFTLASLKEITETMVVNFFVHFANAPLEYYQHKLNGLEYVVRYTDRVATPHYVFFFRNKPANLLCSALVDYKGELPDFFQKFDRSLIWQRRFMEMAEMISEWSKDSHQVGSVIVSKDNKILSTGYNGFPKGVTHFAFREANKELKLEHVIHAEINALMNLDNHNISKYDDKATLYVTKFPCARCMAQIIQSNKIDTIIANELKPSSSWYKSSMIAKQMAEEAKIKIITYEQY